MEDDLTGVVGTALYTAPEVHRRNTAYNQKVDIYSLGVIFFEMCYTPLNTGMERIQARRADILQYFRTWGRREGDFKSFNPCYIYYAR